MSNEVMAVFSVYIGKHNDMMAVFSLNISESIYTYTSESDFLYF